MPDIAAGFVFYVIGAVIAAGAIGGVREEMDGIGDIAIILFWPIALGVLAIKKVCVGFYTLGRKLRGKATKPACWPKWITSQVPPSSTVCHYPPKNPDTRFCNLQAGVQCFYALPYCVALPQD